MTRKLVWMLLLLGGLAMSVSIAAAQDSPPPLMLMQSQTGMLAAEQTADIWSYDSAGTASTVLVKTIEGTLDPALELLNANGDVLVSSNDFAPAFSTMARVSVPAGEDYYLRVSVVFGEGTYQIISIPGNMQLQWDDNFETPNPYWAVFGALTVENGVRLETPMVTTRLFTPNNAPRLSDLYIQVTLRWENFREDSEVGLAARGNLLTTAQVQGYRLVITPTGNWSFQVNDGVGGEDVLDSGSFSLNDGASVTLGLLAEGEQIRYFVDGRLLGEMRDVLFTQNNEWGVLVFDGQVVVQDFWLASPAVNVPDYPDEIASWNSNDPNAIASELIDADLIAPNGQREYMVTGAEYSVNGVSQRNFLITDENVVFDNLALGADVTIRQGADVGCGLISRWQNRDNKILAFVDNQGGAGLLWWDAGELVVNNYAMLQTYDPARNRLLMILQDQYVTLYVNGHLTAQSLIPRHTGNVGVGFVNYAAGDATCIFNNVWVWE